ncbi:organic cation transporter protein-like [Ixodes scapularis]|uniref:organic cation transporter protein-like n=1 Tax=Ixodes scapularis TaxID=6945 RepID=UPI001C394706|nr:organic cation transporter protein-like [Ixodes scapularis]
MDVTSVIGDYGKFQRNIFMFCLLRGFPTGLHLVVYTFFFPAVEHWCAPPDELIGNVTVDQWKAMALPYETGIGGDIRYSSCFMFPVKRVGSELVALENTTVACERWEYGESFYRHSLVQEWDLVCARAWTRSLVQSATMAGMLVGTLVCSSLGDRLGRRPLVIVSLALSLLGGLVVSVSPSFLFLLVSRSLVGLGLGLGQASCFCLLMEVVGPRKRTTTAVAFSLGFALGLCALPAFAWVFQDWRQLQVAISLPLVVFLAWSWYLPESPRWLVATGKLKRARRVLLQAGTANGIEIKNVDSIIEQLRWKITEQDHEAEEVNCSDLLRTRKVRRYSIVLVYASMTCGAVFYGLQFSVTSLGGNPYINFLLAAAAEFPVCLLCYCTVRWCRRRLTMLVIFAVGGACSVAIGLLVFAGPELAWLRQCLGIGGKVLASAALTVVWMFAAEVFPTVLRTVGVGACLVGTRVGGALVPFLIELRNYTNEAVPLIILGGFFFLSAILVLLLPETFRVALPDTLHETEGLSKSRAGDSKRNGEASPITCEKMLVVPGDESPAAKKDAE